MQAAIPLMIGSSLATAYGQFQAGQAEASAYANNARNDQSQARTALDQSFVKAGQVSDETNRAIGRQGGAYGGSGVEVGTGTPLQVMADTAQRGEMARQLTLYQGRVNATSSLRQSDIDMAQSKAAKQASYLAPVATLLGTAARAALGHAMPSAPAGGNIPTGGPPSWAGPDASSWGAG